MSLKRSKFLSVACIVSEMSSQYYAEIHEEFNNTNIFWIALTEQEICAIIQTRAFCVYKTCFPRPGHNYSCIHSYNGGY